MVSLFSCVVPGLWRRLEEHAISHGKGTEEAGLELGAVIQQVLVSVVPAGNQGYIFILHSERHNKKYASAVVRLAIGYPPHNQKQF